MIDCLQKDQTIYASHLRQLKEAIMSKLRRKLRAGVLFLQDKFPVHTAQVTVAEAEGCGFKLLPHALRSLDLAPSDFCLLPKLKSHSRGRCLESDNDVICAVEGYLGAQTPDFFQDGTQKLNIGQSALKFRGTMLN